MFSVGRALSAQLVMRMLTTRKVNSSSPSNPPFYTKNSLSMNVYTINIHKNDDCCVLLVELVRRWPL